MFKKICLICAAVVLAWLSMLILMWFGFAVDKILLATLMGMSVGAVATKYAPGFGWKTLTVILGLLLVWSALNEKFVYAAAALGLILLTLLFSVKLNNKKGAQQPDRFKDCC